MDRFPAYTLSALRDEDAELLRFLRLEAIWEGGEVP